MQSYYGLSIGTILVEVCINIWFISDAWIQSHSQNSARIISCDLHNFICRSTTPVTSLLNCVFFYHRPIVFIDSIIMHINNNGEPTLFFKVKFLLCQVMGKWQPTGHNLFESTFQHNLSTYCDVKSTWKIQWIWKK